jgi:hypothetical protein
MPRFFDYETIAHKAGIAQEDLDAIRQRVQADYPDDDMMQELRLLRTCSAIREGRCTAADAIEPEKQGELPVSDAGTGDRR